MPLQAAYGKAFSTFSSAMSAASAPQCLAFAPGRIWSLVGGSQTGKAVGRRMNATAADAAVLTQSSALGAASARTCVSPLVAGVPEAGRKQVGRLPVDVIAPSPAVPLFPLL